MQRSWLAEQLRLFVQQELRFTQQANNSAVISEDMRTKWGLELKPERTKLKFKVWKSMLEKENSLFLVRPALLRKEITMLKEG